MKENQYKNIDDLSVLVTILSNELDLPENKDRPAAEFSTSSLEKIIDCLERFFILYRENDEPSDLLGQIIKVLQKHHLIAHAFKNQEEYRAQGTLSFPDLFFATFWESIANGVSISSPSNRYLDALRMMPRDQHSRLLYFTKEQITDAKNFERIKDTVITAHNVVVLWHNRDYNFLISMGRSTSYEDLITRHEQEVEKRKQDVLLNGLAFYVNLYGGKNPPTPKDLRQSVPSHILLTHCRFINDNSRYISPEQMATILSPHKDKIPLQEGQNLVDKIALAHQRIAREQKITQERAGLLK